jgi:ABC-type nitrate/sulfonate/bicarbonate transport system substrate-binding protein
LAVLSAATVAACGTSSAAGTSSTGGGDKPLTSVTFALGGSSPTPVSENVELAQALGYCKDEGLTCSILNAGSDQAAEAAVQQGRAQFSVGAPDFQVSQAVAGQGVPIIDFYEYTYPSKYWLVVPKNSPINSLQQLEGKTVAINSEGTSDKGVLDNILKLKGINASTVKTQAVAEGDSQGVAMNQGKVDAVMAYDTTLGAWQAAGISYKVLLSPSQEPKANGQYVGTSSQYLAAHKQICTDYAKAIAEATVYALANPTSAAYMYTKLHPAAGAGESTAQQVQATLDAVSLRSKLWTPYTDPTKFGYIQESEWVTQLTFSGGTGKVKPTQFYTNELSAQVNDFAVAPIQARAKAQPTSPSAY